MLWRAMWEGTMAKKYELITKSARVFSVSCLLMMITGLIHGALRNMCDIRKYSDWKFVMVGFCQSRNFKIISCEISDNEIMSSNGEHRSRRSSGSVQTQVLCDCDSWRRHSISDRMYLFIANDAELKLRAGGGVSCLFSLTRTANCTQQLQY